MPLTDRAHAEISFESGSNLRSNDATALTIWLKGRTQEMTQDYEKIIRPI